MKHALWLTLLMVLAAAPLAAAQEPEEATELEPIVVIAPSGPVWERSDELLRLLVEAQAPCLGCDARPRASAPVLDWRSYLLPPADRVDEATTVARQVHLQDSPDLQYLRR